MTPGYVVTVTRVRPPSKFDRERGESRRLHEEVSRQEAGTLPAARGVCLDHGAKLTAVTAIGEDGGEAKGPDGSTISVERVEDGGGRDA